MHGVPSPTQHIPFEPEAANLFFQLVSSRYERASLIVASNKVFGRWGERSTRPALQHEPRQLRPDPPAPQRLITRLPGRNTYRLTPDGLAFAIFFTKVHNRVLRPLLATSAPTTPPALRAAILTIDGHIDARLAHERLLNRPGSGGDPHDGIPTGSWTVRWAA